MAAVYSYNNLSRCYLPYQHVERTLKMEEKVYRTELTPVSFLERSASVFPDKTAIVHGERRYTSREFAERVYRLASHLRSIGMQKHDRVALDRKSVV